LRKGGADAENLAPEQQEAGSVPQVSERVLITGNVAAAEGAVRGGCRFYFGYPITPQNDLPEYMSARMPEVGGVFIQAESELAAISLVHGVAAAGGRAMTSSSSPGISLKQEGLSYLAGSELPAFIVNVQRGGPGLGDVRCAQGDYYQATRGGGHGDYRLIVLAPHTVQETCDLACEAFDLAEVVNEVPVGFRVFHVVGADHEAAFVQAFPHVVEHVRIVDFLHHQLSP